MNDVKVYCTYHELHGTCTEEDYKDTQMGRNPSRMLRVNFTREFGEPFTQAVPFNTIIVEDIDFLKSEQHADYKSLRRCGIKRTIQLGTNEWGYPEKIIETDDGSQWDYIPEDQIYELRENRFEVSVS